MQKQITQFKSVIDGVESHFNFDSTTSTTTAKLALLDCLKWIGQIEDSQKAQIEAAQEAAQIEAEVPVQKVEEIVPQEATNDQSST
jgi:hypothetical protein